MLTGIGIIIILKQIPYFFGLDKNPEGNFAFSTIGWGEYLNRTTKDYKCRN